jgi:ATP-binding cassette, subfamily C (CFTR/MRP), member 1
MLSYMEHSRSLRPSPLLSIYLIFSILFDAVRVRTLWLVGYDPSIRDLFTASLAMKVLILGMEAKGKRRYFSVADRDLGPEESSGVFSQSFFLWLNALIQQGFKKVLSPTDLYPIDEKMTSEALAASFWQRWLASPKSGKNSLLIALFKHFKWHLLVPVLPRLILIAATFCQPLLINRFLSFLQHPDQSNNIGYGLVVAYGLVYFTIAVRRTSLAGRPYSRSVQVSTGFYWHRTYHGITLVRGSLVSTIYRKTTELSIMTSNSSAAVSLMSTDIERIVNGHRNLHEVWANVISVCIATWLLQTELGLVCLAPILLAAGEYLMQKLPTITSHSYLINAVCFCGAVSLSGPAQKRQGKWMKKLEKRVGTFPFTLQR